MTKEFYMPYHVCYVRNTGVYISRIISLFKEEG